MYCYLSNFGLEELFDDQTKRMELIEYIKQNHTISLQGYNCEYINAYSNKKDDSGIQFSLKKEKDKLCNSIAIHHTNSCVWKFRIMANMSLDLVEGFYLIDSDCDFDKDCISNQAVIKIINKDILPSVLDSDILSVQVSALARSVMIFSEDNAFGKEQIEHFSIDGNNQAHIGVLMNYNAPQKKIVLSDETLLIGIIKEIRYYETELLKVKGHYYSVLLDTLFGEILVYFNENQIESLDKDSFCVGSLIQCVATLSGDAYLDKDRLKVELNPENNFRIFRRAFTEENFNILEPILADNCVYSSKNYKLVGKSMIMDKLNELSSSSKVGVTMRKVTIVKINKRIVKNNDLSIGDECLYYSESNSSGHYLSYIKNNRKKQISKIEMVSPDGYDFVIEFPKKTINNLLNKAMQKNNKKTSRKKMFEKVVSEYYKNK